MSSQPNDLSEASTVKFNWPSKFISNIEYQPSVTEEIKLKPQKRHLDIGGFKSTFIYEIHMLNHRSSLIIVTHRREKKKNKVILRHETRMTKLP